MERRFTEIKKTRIAAWSLVEEIEARWNCRVQRENCKACAGRRAKIWIKSCLYWRHKTLRDCGKNFHECRFANSRRNFSRRRYNGKDAPCRRKSRGKVSETSKSQATDPYPLEQEIQGREAFRGRSEKSFREHKSCLRFHESHFEIELKI